MKRVVGPFRVGSSRVAGILLILVAVAASSFAQISPGRSHLEEKVSLHLRDSDLADVFLTIQKITGWNLVVGPGVSGKVTLDVENATLSSILELMAKRHALAFEDDGSILLVETRADAIRRREAASSGDADPPPPKEMTESEAKRSSSRRGAGRVRYELREGTAVVASGSFDLDRTSREVFWTRAVSGSGLAKTGRVRIAWLPYELQRDVFSAVVDRVDAPAGAARLGLIELSGPDSGGAATFAAEKQRDPLVVRLERLGVDPFRPVVTARGPVLGGIRDAPAGSGVPMTFDFEVYRKSEGREEILSSPRITTEDFFQASIVSGTTARTGAPGEVTRIAIDVCPVWNGELVDLVVRARFDIGNDFGSLEVVRNLAETGAWHIVNQGVATEAGTLRFRFKVQPGKK